MIKKWIFIDRNGTRIEGLCDSPCTEEEVRFKYKQETVYNGIKCFGSNNDKAMEVDLAPSWMLNKIVTYLDKVL